MIYLTHKKINKILKNNTVQNVQILEPKRQKNKNEIKIRDKKDKSRLMFNKQES